MGVEEPAARQPKEIRLENSAAAIDNVIGRKSIKRDFAVGAVEMLHFDVFATRILHEISHWSRLINVVGEPRAEFLCARGASLIDDEINGYPRRKQRFKNHATVNVAASHKYCDSHEVRRPFAALRSNH